MPDIIVSNPNDLGVREKWVQQPDGTHAQQVVIAGGNSSSAGTDRSMTATTSSLQLMAAKAARMRFIVKNDSTVDVWINLGGTAAATPGGGNYRILANGGYFELQGYSGVVNIVAASGTAAVSAMEF